MVKILGGSLVLIAAYLFGMKLMEPAAEHIRLLEEGDLLYRILESEIRNTRTPLPILFDFLFFLLSLLLFYFYKYRLSVFCYLFLYPILIIYRYYSFSIFLLT